MSIKENLEGLSKDFCEFVMRSIDCCKLSLVERLSLLLGNMICRFVVSMLLSVAYFLALAAIVVWLAPFVGWPLSLLSAAVMLVVAAIVVYCLRVRLFVNGAVKWLCRLFFDNAEDDGR